MWRHLFTSKHFRYGALFTGIGAIGLAVFGGMIASTCLVVVFVPSFFVVMQRLQEGRRKGEAPNAPQKGASEAAAPSAG